MPAHEKPPALPVDNYSYSVATYGKTSASANVGLSSIIKHHLSGVIMPWFGGHLPIMEEIR